MNLNSEERLVYKVPTLFSQALCAAVVANIQHELSDLYERFNIPDEVIRIIRQECVCCFSQRSRTYCGRYLCDIFKCAPGTCVDTVKANNFWLYSNHPVDFEGNKFNWDALHAYVEQETYTVPKEQVNDIVQLEARESLKRKLVFDEQPTSKQRKQ